MKKLVVHLHIYYKDMWKEIKSYLSNITVPYDLYVTMVSEDSKLTEDIKRFHKNSIIWIVENRGYDIGPFIDFLHRINLNEYDYILKLHTKSKSGVDTVINRLAFSKNDWVNTLLKSLIGSKKQFDRNIIKLEEQTSLGMIGSKVLISSKGKINEGLKDKLEFLQDKFGYRNKNVKFIPGTMFLCRAKLMQIIKDNYKITDFEKTDAKVKDGSLGHVLERLFGYIVIAQGYKIDGFDSFLPIYLKYFYKSFFKLFYQNTITNSNHRIIKICKIPVYHKKMKEGI